MNCVNMKKSCLAFFACGFLFTQALLAENNENMQFKDDERIYVHKLASEIEQMFKFFKDNVTKFIDATNHTPYRKLVMGMSDKLDEFEKQVVMTLDKKLVEAKTKNTEVFNQSLTIVQEVLTEFMTKVNVLRNILVKDEYLKARDGILAIKLGKELEKHCKDLFDGKMITQLLVKIDKVFDLVSAAGDQALTDRLEEIKIILKAFKGTSLTKKSGNNNVLSIVNGITAKIRHNKP